MKSLDNYVNDRLGFRDQSVQLYRQLTIKQLNFKHKDVIVGNDGWLFYSEELPDYTGANNTQETTDRYIAVLKQINCWCEERGIQFIFAVGPNKASIYSEYMPSYIKQANTTLLDALMEKTADEGILMLCPKKELLEDKDNQELYMRLDTHWNHLGAKYMITQLAETLNMDSYDIPVASTYESTGDLKDMLNIGNTGALSLMTDLPMATESTIEPIPDTKHQIVHSPNKESFVCYRDSFSIALTSFYSYYFDGPMFWEFAIDFDYINSARPKYLVLECVERYIPQAIESNAAVLNWNLG